MTLAGAEIVTEPVLAIDTVREALPLQPADVVTFTLYVVVALCETVMVWVVAPFDQAYVE
jgi:hypothetical protein